MLITPNFKLLLAMASLFHYLFNFLLLQLPLLISAQTSNKITLGSSISNLDKNPYWTSPSGDFAFGFHPHPHHQDLFLLATWYAKIPVKTIVWTANNGKSVERGAKIELTSNGVLSLTASNGTMIWKAEAIDNSQVAYAAMLNTGNFVLSTKESKFVWATFDNPTDTILPSQILDFTKQTDTKLSCQVSEDEYTIGKFVLILQGDGNLVFYSIARPTEKRNEAYWESGTADTGTQLVFNQSGYIYITLKGGGIHYLSSERPVSTEEYYQRAILDYDGVFRKYTYPKSSSKNGWSTSWSLPQDICRSSFGEYGSGVCGFNSYCKQGKDLRPECLCPPGYSYIYPNNTFKGCKPNFVQQVCETDKQTIVDGFEMQELPRTDWPFADYEWFKPMTEDICKVTCLKDCFCAVAISRGDDCWLKKFPLSRGFMVPDSDRTALIKVGNSSTGENGQMSLDYWKGLGP